MRWTFLLLSALALSGIYYVNENWRHGLRDHLHSRHTKVIQRELLRVAVALRSSAVQSGMYPTNDEGLGSLARLELFAVKRPPADDYYRDDDLAIIEGSTDCLEPVTGALIGMGGLPLVYENRRGLSPLQFAHSPVSQCPRSSWLLQPPGSTPDGAPLWLARVDDGVFVYSTPGLCFAREADAVALSASKLSAELGGVALFFVVLSIASLRRSSRLAIALPRPLFFALNLALAFAIIVVVLATEARGCVSLTQIRNIRSHSAYLEYSRLINQYVCTGVLGRSAAERLIECAGPEAWRLRRGDREWMRRPIRQRTRPDGAQPTGTPKPGRGQPDAQSTGPR